MSVNSPKGATESIALIDDQSWIWALVKRQLELHDTDYVRLPLTVPIRQSWHRFRRAPRIIIHWEGQSRAGGAIVEEILDVEPHYDVSNNIIVVTSNPTREDVVYFAELGIKRVVRLRNHSKYLAISAAELKAHLTRGPDKSTTDALWRRLNSDLRKLCWDGSPEDVEKAHERHQKLVASSEEADSSRSLDAKATILALQGHDQEAVDTWHLALDQNPNYFKIYNTLISFLRHKGELKEALSLMKKMQDLNKSNISRLVEMGEIQVELEDDGRAEHYFQSALERDSFCTGALNGLAEIRFRQGDLDESRKLLSKSQRAEQIASKLNKTGIQLVKEKRYAEALEHYTRAQYVLPLQEKGPMLFYNIGLCYSRWGKYEMAREFLQIALIKEPNYQKADRLLASIETKLSGEPLAQ